MEVRHRERRQEFPAFQNLDTARVVKAPRRLERSSLLESPDLNRFTQLNVIMAHPWSRNMLHPGFPDER